jgi:hypothetical protein
MSGDAAASQQVLNDISKMVNVVRIVRIQSGYS